MAQNSTPGNNSGTNNARFALFTNRGKYYVKYEGCPEREVICSEYNYLQELKNRALENFINEGIPNPKLDSLNANYEATMKAKAA